jgi:hypothetical protein
MFNQTEEKHFWVCVWIYFENIFRRNLMKQCYFHILILLVQVLSVFCLFVRSKWPDLMIQDLTTLATFIMSKQLRRSWYWELRYHSPYTDQVTACRLRVRSVTRLRHEDCRSVHWPGYGMEIAGPYTDQVTAWRLRVRIVTMLRLGDCGSEYRETQEIFSVNSLDTKMYFLFLRDHSIMQVKKYTKVLT